MSFLRRYYVHDRQLWILSGKKDSLTEIENDILASDR